MKQILNLSHYPEDILLQLMQWRSGIQLTASTMDELASNLKDHLRAQTRTIKDFVLENEVQEVILSSMSPRDKTERLRRLIHAKRFPVLSEINKRIEEKVSQLHLPESISLNWDRTLENKNVEIIVRLHDHDKFEGSLKTLDSSEMKKAVKDILDEL
jgi:Trm5-related predicted tRNA methylase